MCAFQSVGRKIHTNVSPRRPFYGFKALRIDRNLHLVSDVMATSWVDGKLSGLKPDTNGKGRGIHAYSSSNSFYLHPDTVVVEVALWGMVVEYFDYSGNRTGFMAEHAEIHVVYTRNPTLVRRILAHTDITVRKHENRTVKKRIAA